MRNEGCRAERTISEVEPKWESFIVPDENKGKGFFVYWVIGPAAFEQYPIRHQKHKLEPNLESRTYNLYGHCQQPKMRKHIFKERKADNFLVWNRRKGVDRILGCYENISHTAEAPDKKYGKRCAFLAENTYVLKENRAVPLSEFGIEVDTNCVYLSNWVQVLDADKTSRIIERIKEKVGNGEGRSSVGYLRLIERYRSKHGDV
jgi:hypothetical protein